MPQQPPYRAQVLDHLGLVAGMFDELGVAGVIDRATQQNPDMHHTPVPQTFIEGAPHGKDSEDSEGRKPPGDDGSSLVSPHRAVPDIA